MLGIFSDHLLFSAVLIFVYMTLWFLFSLIIRRNDIADIAWGLGFIVVAWGLQIARVPTIVVLSPFFMITLLTTLWGIRLAFHIFSRNKNKPEDARYKVWRDSWGKWFILRSYLQVYLLQGFLMLLISLSAIVTSTSIRGLSSINYFGIVVWFIGFLFESVGDYQLSVFLKHKKEGEVLTTGLWRFTRHPNYFGEVTQWWGLYLVAFGSSLFWVALLSPITITYLILKVSGIPMLERRYEKNKEFQNYKRTTSAFFPWFPKRSG